MAVYRAGTVAFLQAGCVEALDYASVALALGSAGNVNIIAGNEHVSLNNIAELERSAVLKTELLQVLLQGVASLLQVTLLGLVQASFLNILKTELYSIVAVLLFGLELSYNARTCFDYGAGNNLAVSIEDLGHTDLLADDCFVQHLFFLLKGYWLTAFDRQHDLAARVAAGLQTAGGLIRSAC